ncbi:MAG: ankyrin repeat domain-containing protein [Phenylobacterium sp.]
MTSPRTFLEIRASYPDDWEIGVLADVQSVCGDGDTLLHRVAYKGNRQDIRDLVALGSDPNALGDMGNTPLHYAAMNGHLLPVLALLDSGAKSDLKNEFGQTPADCAGMGKHFQLEAVLRRTQK